MGDSGNSNNDDNDNGDHNESGSILENSVLPHSKPTKQGHQGSLSGTETVYKELQCLLPFSTDPATVTELPQNTAPKYLFLSKQNKTKQPRPSYY